MPLPAPNVFGGQRLVGGLRRRLNLGIGGAGEAREAAMTNAIDRWAKSGTASSSPSETPALLVVMRRAKTLPI